MKTLSSIVTPSHTNVWLDILHLFPTNAFFCISTNAPIFVSSPISQPYKLMNLESLTPLPSFTSGVIEQNSFTGAPTPLSFELNDLPPPTYEQREGLRARR